MYRLLLIALFIFIHDQGIAQNNDLPVEQEYYRIVTLPIPEGVILEVGGLATLPDGNLAVATRRGDVWLVEKPYYDVNDPAPRYFRFAEGLHEALGLQYRNGALYTTQRGELTRLVDRNRDGVADRYEAIAALPISGNYHEYSYGPAIASNGDMFVSGNVGFLSVEWWRGASLAPWRGWTLRISPEGEIKPFASGMRSPAGLAVINDEVFYTDNQGDWIPSGGLWHLEEGDFTGNTAGLRWTSLEGSPLDLKDEDVFAFVDPKMAAPGERPIKPENDPSDPGTPLYELAEHIDAIKLPAVYLPHGILGTSNSDIVIDETEGAFGPFSGQVFIGDQGLSIISRVFLEKVNNEYQGAAFLFREGFQSGVMRMAWGSDGSMFIGQTGRGWGSRGGDPYGLQRLIWTGETPFEMLAVRAMPDGFEIEFTQPVDRSTAEDPASYAITSFIYKYHPVYGSPIIRAEVAPIRGIVVSEDGMKARLVVDGMREKYIHELKATGVRSEESTIPLLHDTAYYTLNHIPEGERLDTTLFASPAPLPRVVDASTRKRESMQSPKSRESKNPLTMPDGWTTDQALTISTQPGLKFDTERIVVEAGSRVALTFNNDDDMPHNLVITMPGQGNTVGESAARMGIQGPNMDYVPDSDEVTYFVKLLAPGTSQTIYIDVPSRPGEYPFVCTVPGHFFTMKGIMEVR